MARAYERMRRNLAGVLTIGVTGTKGKTSTCEFIAQLMEASGLLTAVSTTESGRIGTRYVEACENGRELYALVAQCRRSGVQCLVVEMCSSMLKWNMHTAFDLDVAVLTNMGTDHIRYHGNRRNYLAVKQRIFRDLASTPDSPRPIAILNADDPRLGAFRKILPQGVMLCLYGWRRHSTAGGAPLHLWASDITNTIKGTSFRIHGLAGGPLSCRTALHGDFNVSNVLAAIACGAALGGRPRHLVARAGHLVPPAGRFEMVVSPNERHPAVVVDFAHTPESLHSALAAARALFPHGRVHAVFGCGGDAYKGKRPMMGKVATTGADTVTITNDNPRSEEPRAIARAILRGVPRVRRGAVRVELDRARAIQSAIEQARAGDVVLLLGKGTEQTQEIGRRTVPFSDARVARLAIESRGRAAGSGDLSQLSARAAILIDQRGHVLFARHPDVAHPPASLAKLMTLYLAFDGIAKKRARLDDLITLSSYAALTPRSVVPRRVGDRVRLCGLLEAVAICSDNVAATAVAEHLCGDEAAFVARMNAKALHLGLKSTQFATPHGLPHRTQKSTARDLARLVMRLLRDHPLSGEMLRRQSLGHGGRAYARKIPLFRDPGGIAALKTGFTNESGYNIAVTARCRGKRLVAVALGAATRKASFSEAARLLRYAMR